MNSQRCTTARPRASGELNRTAQLRGESVAYKEVSGAVMQKSYAQVNTTIFTSQKRLLLHDCVSYINLHFLKFPPSEVFTT